MKKMDTHQYRWVALGFICLALLVVSINDTIVNIILPLIARDLGSSTTQLQWIADSYILVIASLLLTMGTLSDRFGRKLFLQIGIIIFSVGSVLGFFAESGTALILARAFQGIGSSILFPSTLSLMSSTFSKRDEHSKAIAIWSAMFGLGVSIGPLLGGWIVTMPQFNWNTTFLINLPFAVLALIGVHFFVSESKDTTFPKIDVPGVVLSTISLFALVFGIIEAGAGEGFSTTVLVSFLVFAITLYVFIRWEKHSPNAMLPLYLFKNPSFTVANITMTLILFALIGFDFLIPQYFQGVQGYTPLETALRMLPQAILSVGVTIYSARLVKIFGIKRTMLGGIILSALGLIFIFAVLQPHTAYIWLLLGMILLFFGIDSAMPATTMSIMGSIPVDKAGIGSAMNDMTGQIGGALGVALFGSMLNRTYLQQTAQLQSQISAADFASIQNSIFSAHTTILTLPADLQAKAMELVNQAFVIGMKETLVICTLTMLLIAYLVYRFLPNELRRSSVSEQNGNVERKIVENKAGLD